MKWVNSQRHDSPPHRNDPTAGGGGMAESPALIWDMEMPLFLCSAPWEVEKSEETSRNISKLFSQSSV